MVLKRRLPSAMASEANKSKEAKASASSVAPKQEEPPVASNDIPDEVAAESKPPLAPKPDMEISSSAIPDTDNDISFKELPENDIALDTDKNKTDESSLSWDEEPENSGWEIDDLGNSDPPDDVFGSMADEVKKEEKPKDNSQPWQQGAVGEPPELPSEIAAAGPILPSSSTEKAGPVGALVGIILLVAIGFGGYSFFYEKDEATEVISRWTGSLNEVSEEIPTGKITDVKRSEKTASMLQPEAVVVMDKKNDDVVVEFIEAEEPMEDEIPPANNIAVSLRDQEKADNQTIVEFVDVPEDEVEQPLDAEEAGEMPEEVGMIVQLQQAITDARKEKNPDNYKAKEEQVVEKTEEKSEAEILEMLSPDELDERNKELSRQLDEELAEYRKILAGESGDKPRKLKPSEFFDKGIATADSATAESAKGSIPLPKRQSSLLSQKQAESFYGANPYNLPIVPEPTAKETSTVRTLDDFDVSMFQIKREHVRIPKNIKPSFRATTFPKLILLSIVRGKGIIAEVNHKQGVLLVGESVSGWELVAVKQEYAEFSNGKRKHIINIGR